MFATTVTEKFFSLTLLLKETCHIFVKSGSRSRKTREVSRRHQGRSRKTSAGSTTQVSESAGILHYSCFIWEDSNEELGMTLKTENRNRRLLLMLLCHNPCYPNHPLRQGTEISHQGNSSIKQKNKV